MNDELKMGKGKIAAQCGHGVAGIFTKYRRKQQSAFQQWEMFGGAKIALKVPSTKELVSRMFSRTSYWRCSARNYVALTLIKHE